MNLRNFLLIPLLFCFSLHGMEAMKNIANSGYIKLPLIGVVGAAAAVSTMSFAFPALIWNYKFIKKDYDQNSWKRTEAEHYNKTITNLYKGITAISGPSLALGGLSLLYQNQSPIFKNIRTLSFTLPAVVATCCATYYLTKRVSVELIGAEDFYRPEYFKPKPDDINFMRKCLNLSANPSKKSLNIYSSFEISLLNQKAMLFTPLAVTWGLAAAYSYYRR